MCRNKFSLSFHHVNSGDRTQAIRLGDRCLHPWSRLTGPFFSFSVSSLSFCCFISQCWDPRQASTLLPSHTPAPGFIFPCGARYQRASKIDLLIVCLFLFSANITGIRTFCWLLLALQHLHQCLPPSRDSLKLLKKGCVCDFLDPGEGSRKTHR